MYAKVFYIIILILTTLQLKSLKHKWENFPPFNMQKILDLISTHDAWFS